MTTIIYYSNNIDIYTDYKVIFHHRPDYIITARINNFFRNKNPLNCVEKNPIRKEITQKI